MFVHSVRLWMRSGRRVIRDSDAADRLLDGVLLIGLFHFRLLGFGQRVKPHAQVTDQAAGTFRQGRHLHRVRRLVEPREKPLNRGGKRCLVRLGR